jgi:hypothetical protein
VVSGVPVRPDCLVGNPVETGVGVCAAADLDLGGELRPEAEVVVLVADLEVGRRALPLAAFAVRGDVAAEVEVADLVGEGNVVGVGHPGDARLLR